jgi:outer membrane protein TolC
MRTIILGSTLVLLAATLEAQTPIRLTLEDALARGLQASHRLAELDARREAAAATGDARAASDKPIVSLQGGYTRTNHVTPFIVPGVAGQLPRVLYPDVPDNWRTRIDLQWPIYSGGRSDALERAARAEAEALGQDRLTAQADLRLDITRAFWAIITAGATVQVLEDSVASVEAHLTDVRNRLSVGLVPPNDVLSTEAQRSREQVLLIEARNLLESARTDLRRLIDVPADAPIEIDDGSLAPLSVPTAPPDSLVEQARVGRSERRALDNRIQGARELEDAADAARLPSLAVIGGYDYARPNPRIFPRVDEWRTSWDLGVGVNWSFWDGGRVKADLAEAVANRRAIEERLLDFDTVLSADVRQRRLDLASALAAIPATEDGVRSATEARRVVSERFSAGVATNTEVLDAQLAMLQAELDRTRAIASARLAAARLDRALGR